MRVLESPTQPAAPLPVSPIRLVLARLADYRELTKPRVTFMALLTVAAGFFLVDSGTAHLATLAHALFGIALVAGSCGALNQFLERRSDVEMLRTAGRPLPAGRMSAAEALIFGLGTGVAGLVYLAWFVNGTTAVLTGLTLVLYVWIYTPMKRYSSWCTVVGAIPGAMPPVLGWTAAGGDGSPLMPITLFGILFVWQFPHLLSIAWLYRKQYAAAGLHMLPHRQFPPPGVTGMWATLGAVALIPVSLLPTFAGVVGGAYTAIAIALGCGYLLYSVIFWLRESRRSARRLFWTSLLYLPVVLAVLAIDFGLLT